MSIINRDELIRSLRNGVETKYPNLALRASKIEDPLELVNFIENELSTPKQEELAWQACMMALMREAAGFTNKSITTDEDK